MEQPQDISRQGPPADADLWLIQARAGDGAGFDGLYRWLSGAVRGFAATRNAVDAEGVVNDVFLKAFRSIEGFEGDAAAFRSWIFRTTRNHLIDQARTRSRRPQLADGEIPELPSPGADELAMASIGNERVARLLGELTAAQREVLVLRVVADLGLNEVADIVGRPVTAVKRLQARGLRALQQKISDEAVSE